jgi:hypothetical protein
VQCDGRLVCFGDIHESGRCNVPAGFVCCGKNDGTPNVPTEPALPQVKATDEHVQHIGPPTRIDPMEAAEIAAEQYASYVSHNIDAAAGPPFDANITEIEPQEMEPLLLLQFSRSTRAFQAALFTSDVLEPVRAALSAAGYRPLLPSEATIFTDPAHFTAAMMSIAGRVLQPCHVIVMLSLEPLVHEAVNQLQSKQKIRLRRAEPVGYVGQVVNEESRVVIVRRTFLEIPHGSFRAPYSVIQSTTEALERHAVNPQRWNVE